MVTISDQHAVKYPLCNSHWSPLRYFPNTENKKERESSFPAARLQGGGRFTPYATRKGSKKEKFSTPHIFTAKNHGEPRASPHSVREFGASTFPVEFDIP